MWLFGGGGVCGRAGRPVRQRNQPNSRRFFPKTHHEPNPTQSTRGQTHGLQSCTLSFETFSRPVLARGQTCGVRLTTGGKCQSPGQCGQAGKVGEKAGKAPRHSLGAVFTIGGGGATVPENVAGGGQAVFGGPQGRYISCWGLIVWLPKGDKGEREGQSSRGNNRRCHRIFSKPPSRT